jgi:tetratricopeptide (TPR) repeat protein
MRARLESSLMLRFVKRLRESYEVRRHRTRALRDASPKSTIKLCRLLERYNRHHQVVIEARHGIKRFPHAYELEDILRKSFEKDRRAQATTSQIKIKKDPALSELCEAVGSYLEFAKLDDAARAARELATRFPRDPEALVLHGKVFKALFVRDHASRDGKAALESFSKAVDLDSASLDARRGLAETYGLIGATSQAMFHCLLALEIKPNDPLTNRLFAKLKSQPLKRRDERDLLWEAEVNDQPLSEKKALPTDASFNTKLVEGIKRLVNMPSVRRVAMRHRGIAMVATRDRLRPASEQSDPFLAAVEKFRKGASTWAKRVDVGGFEEATLMLGGATVLAVVGGASVLALEIDGSPELATMAEEARHLMASWTASEYRDLEWVR